MLDSASVWSEELSRPADNTLRQIIHMPNPIIVYNSFTIIPGLKTSQNMLTSIDFRPRSSFACFSASSGNKEIRVKYAAILYCSSKTRNLVPRASRLPSIFSAFMLNYWHHFPHIANVFQIWSTQASYKELYSLGIWVNQKRRNIEWIYKPCFQWTQCLPRLFGRWASNKHEGSRRTGISQCDSHHR